jgi:hypothetical protein
MTIVLLMDTVNPVVGRRSSFEWYNIRGYEENHEIFTSEFYYYCTVLPYLLSSTVNDFFVTVLRTDI